MTGRCSELRETIGFYLALMPRWGLVELRFGEDVRPDCGRLVLEGPLIHMSCPASGELQMASPLLTADSSFVS